MQHFKHTLFSTNSGNFEQKALELFRYQAEHNPVYRRYLSHLPFSAQQVQSIYQIPFLPIELFKSQRVVTGNPEIQVIFESSGTSGQTPSRHYVADPLFYKQVSQHMFERLYKPLKECHLFALLPSYLERKNSSLVYMVSHFIQQSQSPYSGFFLHQNDALIDKLISLRNHSGQVILLGVTFALLDLAEAYAGTDLSHVILMETGGMKGRREELLREELHEELQKAFKVPAIHAEYGMTELLSQAYSTGGGAFQTPPWMRILIRDVNDPFHIYQHSRSGGINIIDLANVDSCAFIETKDIGILSADGTFRVLGRFDNSDIRGCNLLVS
ncbi:acyl transferase [Rhodocytophaga rosea]|uniref:Acyl transferase n=1 Tax=Rhodocytophaga rosea TaxID=2704465 RepID=A0A6C0GVA7_9BACT|nr:acyl transferase [Rhodocytophaga rosea]